MKLETRAVHAGRSIDPATRAVASPIHLSTTFERAPDGSYPEGYAYSREDNPNRRALEQCLAALESGREALVFASGLAVVTALVTGLEPGDHILAPDDTYYGFHKVVNDLFARWPLQVSYVDMTDMTAVEAAMQPNTRLVWVETPSNPLLKVTDLAAIGRLCRQTKAISVCDSTFATPVLQRPLEHDIDMVMHSTTKYMGGHSDVLGGVLVNCFDNYLFERARKAQHYGGGVPSPFECWLTRRGLDTLPLRVREQSRQAQVIAEHLSRHPRVERVHYPGLPGHPGHEVARRQMSGFGGMLSFEVAGGAEEATGVAARTRLIIRATSLGGTHSLIEHRASVEGPDTRTPQGLLRLSIGLEHLDDLIDDLDQALTA